MNELPEIFFFNHMTIASTLRTVGAVTFQVTDNVNEFTVFMCSRFFTTGLPQGGDPIGRVYVSMVRYGRLWHFKIPKIDQEPTHWSYFAEKMELPDDIAKMVAEPINKVLFEYGRIL